MPRDVSSSSEGESENPPKESQSKQLGTSTRNNHTALVGWLVGKLISISFKPGFTQRETRTQ